MSTETLCSHEWDKYLKTAGKAKKGWELIMDDFRNVNVYSEVGNRTGFLKHFTDLMKTLFVVSEKVMSKSVRDEFVKVTVERMKELINFDYANSTLDSDNVTKKRVCQVIPLLRSTEDTDTDTKRKTEMILVMVLRITRPREQVPNNEKVHIENSIKVRIRSIKIKDSSLQSDGSSDPEDRA